MEEFVVNSKSTSFPLGIICELLLLRWNTSPSFQLGYPSGCEDVGILPSPSALTNIHKVWSDVFILAVSTLQHESSSFILFSLISEVFDRSFGIMFHKGSTSSFTYLPIQALIQKQLSSVSLHPLLALNYLIE